MWMWPITPRFDAERAYHLVMNKLDKLTNQIRTGERRIMSTFDDLKAAQDATDAKVAAVKADVEKLLDALKNVPPAGLTPEQQAALDAAVAHANAINDSLGAVDAEVNPPAPVEEPAPTPVEEPAPVVEPTPAPEGDTPSA
jgi:predicted  nucleic acid-binding Zn-ribbon protein